MIDSFPQRLHFSTPAKNLGRAVRTQQCKSIGGGRKRSFYVVHTYTSKSSGICTLNVQERRDGEREEKTENVQNIGVYSVCVLGGRKK